VGAVLERPGDRQTQREGVRARQQGLAGGKELRHSKAVFKKAVEWKCLGECPRIKFEREATKVPRYMTEEHFAAILASTSHATKTIRTPRSATSTGLTTSDGRSHR
jgi:hypothetical protein